MPGHWGQHSSQHWASSHLPAAPQNRLDLGAWVEISPSHRDSPQKWLHLSPALCCHGGSRVQLSAVPCCGELPATWARVWG